MLEGFSKYRWVGNIDEANPPVGALSYFSLIVYPPVRRVRLKKWVGGHLHHHHHSLAE